MRLAAGIVLLILGLVTTVWAVVHFWSKPKRAISEITLHTVLDIVLRERVWTILFPIFLIVLGAMVIVTEFQAD